jgi:hypothetical protein
MTVHDYWLLSWNFEHFGARYVVVFSSTRISNLQVQHRGIAVPTASDHLPSHSWLAKKSMGSQLIHLLFLVKLWWRLIHRSISLVINPWRKTCNIYVSAILVKIDGDPPKNIIRPTGVFPCAAALAPSHFAMPMLPSKTSGVSKSAPSLRRDDQDHTPAPFAMLGFRDIDSGPQPWSTQGTQDSFDKLCFF